jgi:hemoglobin/transferrin/lactoferrin receptor protein
MTAVKRLTSVPKNQPKRAGFMVHSLQSEWQPMTVPNLTLNLAVHNLLDKKYAEHTTLYSGATGIVAETGRDVRVSATYQF